MGVHKNEMQRERKSNENNLAPLPTNLEFASRAPFKIPFFHSSSKSPRRVFHVLSEGVRGRKAVCHASVVRRLTDADCTTNE